MPESGVEEDRTDSERRRMPESGVEEGVGEVPKSIELE
jgi:hypothetical protein